jgi:glucokinase
MLPRMDRAILGIDLGGTFIKAAVVSPEGKLLTKCETPTHAEDGPEAVFDAIGLASEEILSSTGLANWDVAACGIGAPGPLDWRSGIVFSPANLPGWRDVPLAEILTKRLGVQCFVENDANAACYGEFWRGAGQGADNMCLLTLGTGLGGGIVVAGRLLRGPDGTAAEVGHIIVQRDGRLCGCGARGCIETYGSVTGLVRTARYGLEAGEASVLRESCDGDWGALTGAMVSEAAEEGDSFAREVIRTTGEWLGLGIANLINLLNPEKVVLAGGMTKAGEMLLEPIRETAARIAFDVPAARAEIVMAGLGEDAGVIGAAGCAWERFSRGC